MKTTKNEYFIAGMMFEMKRQGIEKQGEFAKKSGLSPGSLSRYTHGSTIAKRSKIKICNALGKDENELIVIGMSASGKRAEISSPQVTPTNYLPSAEIVSFLNTVSSSYVTMETRLRYWQTLFDVLPVASLVIRDGLVYNQNQKSRDIGIIIGQPLCENCIDKNCDRKDCSILEAMRKIRSTSEVKELDGIKYQVNTNPFIINDKQYFIVTAVMVS